MKPMSIGSFFDTLGQSQKVYSRLLEPVCRKWNLTRNELDVLLFLYNNPQYDRAADIVTHRGMAKSHVSLSVANLADREFLQRRCSPDDRRTVHLSLTEQGQSVATEGREAQNVFFQHLYAGIPSEELEAWAASTEKIRNNIDNISKTLTNP